MREYWINQRYLDQRARGERLMAQWREEDKTTVIDVDKESQRLVPSA